MHEVLAIILWCIDQDSLADSATRSPKDDIELLANTVLSYDYVEHDAYAVYNILMTHMLSWYDPAQTVALPSNNGIQPTLVQPIVLKCARIHDMLRKVDSDLWKRMEELQIEPQIYGLRWLRLLFSREFPLADTYVAFVLILVYFITAS
jgi:TBC1 domain family protein 5